MNIIWNPVAVEDDGSEWVQRSEAEAKIREAVAGEREACARIASSRATPILVGGIAAAGVSMELDVAVQIAKAIRARAKAAA